MANNHPRGNGMLSEDLHIGSKLLEPVYEPDLMHWVDRVWAVTLLGRRFVSLTLMGGSGRRVLLEVVDGLVTSRVLLADMVSPVPLHLFTPDDDALRFLHEVDDEVYYG